jgi:hypothetical protein
LAEDREKASAKTAFILFLAAVLAPRRASASYICRVRGGESVSLGECSTAHSVCHGRKKGRNVCVYVLGEEKCKGEKWVQWKLSKGVKNKNSRAKRIIVFLQIRN